MSWRDHDYDVELGVELPEIPVSEGEDWISDCEEDDVFDLRPEFFTSKNRYDAALELCRVCSGWFYFESEEQMTSRIELLREILNAGQDSPMNYYDVSSRGFDWISALRDKNDRYSNSLYGVDGLWQLFNMLGERSWLEKAECFEWLIDFFGDALRYDAYRGNLIEQFLSGYSTELETELFIRPTLIQKILDHLDLADGSDLVNLAGAAAGLIRYGMKDEGLRIYKTVFDAADERKENSETRKSMIDTFMERLSKGYDDEPYLSSEVTETITDQIRRFTDKGWMNKVETTIRRNRL